MKDTPIFFTRCGNFTIKEFLNQTKNKPMTKLFELEEENRYDGLHYYLKIDGVYHKAFSTYEEAKEEYDKALNFTYRKTILESKEVEL